MSAPTEKFLKIGDFETHMRVAGTGEPLLLLHGFATADIWLPFHDELAKNFTVYAPDHPGFGRSSLPEWVDEMEDFVIHYAMLLDELKLGPVNVAGFSLGGWIAAELASYYPERVKKLALIDAAGLRVPDAPLVDLFALAPEQLAALCFNDLKNAKILMGDMSDPVARVIQDYRERTTLALIAWNPGYSPKLHRRLSRVKSPALVIWGDEDKLIPPAHAEAYRNAIPGARLEYLKGCNHMPIIERAEETARLLSDFFGGGER